jgi:hypothetical protein
MPVEKRRNRQDGRARDHARGAGDVLTAVSRIVDVYEKPGNRSRSMTFAVTEAEYRNAQGARVGRGLTVATKQDEAIELMADLAGCR